MALNPFSGYGPQGHYLPSFNNADFPACKMWLRCEEGTGTTLADKIGATTGLTIQNAGTNWAVPHGVTLSSATPGQWAETLITNSTMTLPPGVFWIEADITQQNQFADTAQSIAVIADISDVDTTTAGGIRFGSSVASAVATTATMNCSVKTTNGTGRVDPNGAAFHNITSWTLGVRNHIIFIADCSGTLGVRVPQFVSFVNGAEIANTTLTAGAVGADLNVGNYFSGTGRKIMIGDRMTSGSRKFKGTIHNLRIWRTNTMPSNYQAIAADMFRNRDEFPLTMRALT